ncbi:MAG: hypothetical protein BWY79_00949 [Actinobacteria bacterium ADurb.Bin444]|nr:MAG: hypothetical protein BWY79_00949 [Actinobacteria bacterium ADurb.Bin444]
MAMQKVLDLHRIYVLTAGDDHVLLAVHQVDEAVLIRARHISGQQPALFEDRGGGFRILVVALHDTGAFHCQLAHVSLLHGVACFIDDLDLPEMACFSNGAHLVRILDSQVHAAGTDGFAEAVVRVVIVVGEARLPALYQARRHRLGTDVHQAPLIQLVAGEVDLVSVDGVQDVLRPGHQQPHDGTGFVRYRAYDPLRPDTA